MDLDLAQVSYLKAEKYLLVVQHVLRALSASKTWGDLAASWSNSASSYFKPLWINGPRHKAKTMRTENTNVLVVCGKRKCK